MPSSNFAKVVAEYLRSFIARDDSRIQTSDPGAFQMLLAATKGKHF